MKKPNRDIFCQTYPEFWLESRDARVQDKTHYQYQEITLASLRCFDGCELLECGCGSGDLLARLRHSHPNVRLYGLDLGRQSLEWAQRGPLAGQDVSLIEGDLVSLPIASDRFDRILCSSVMWYVPEPHVAIAELVRVLKPGGRFVFDVRPPYHVTNALARWSLAARRMIGETVLTYSFLSPRAVARLEFHVLDAIDRAHPPFALRIDVGGVDQPVFEKHHQQHHQEIGDRGQADDSPDHAAEPGNSGRHETSFSAAGGPTLRL